jgi:hypothetical protein
MTAGVDFGIAVVGHLMGEQTGKLFELLFAYAPRPAFGVKKLMPVQELGGKFVSAG